MGFLNRFFLRNILRTVGLVGPLMACGVVKLEKTPTPPVPSGGGSNTGGSQPSTPTPAPGTGTTAGPNTGTGSQGTPSTAPNTLPLEPELPLLAGPDVAPLLLKTTESKNGSGVTFHGPGLWSKFSFSVSGGMVAPKANRAYLEIANVDFKTGGYRYIQVGAAALTEGHSIELRVGSPTGTLVGTVPLRSTRSLFHVRPSDTWDSRTAISAGVLSDSNALVGIKNVFVVFVYRNPLLAGSADGQINLDFVRILGAPLYRQFYVSPQGSATANGLSESTPLASVGAAMKMLRPGDTLTLLPGTYKESIDFRLQNSGLPQMPITVKGKAGAVVELSGQGVAVGPGNGILINSADFMRYDNIRFRDSPYHGFFNRGDYVVVSKCHFFKNKYSGVFDVGSAFTTYTDNEVYENALSTDIKNTSGGWYSGLSLGGYSNRVVGNRIYKNLGEGLIVGGESDDTQVLRNVAFDNFSNNIYLDKAKNTRIAGNILYSTNTTYTPPGQPGFLTLPNGIVMADEQNGSTTGMGCSPLNFTRNESTIIENNVIVGTRHGIYFGYWQGTSIGTCSGLIKTTIRNNTIVNSWESALRIDNSPASTGNTISNNIILSKTNKFGFGSTLATLCYTPSSRFLSNILWADSDTTSGRFFSIQRGGTGACDGGTLQDLHGGSGLEASGNVMANDLSFVNRGVLSGDIWAAHQLSTAAKAKYGAAGIRDTQNPLAGP